MSLSYPTTQKLLPQRSKPSPSQCLTLQEKIKAQGALAFNAVPASIQPKLRQYDRVVLVANNPSITKAHLNELLKPTDIVVLFNHFIHAHYFATAKAAKTLPKLLFFRQIGDSLLHFGLPPRHNNLASIEQMLAHAPIGFLLSNIDYQFPTLQDDPSPEDDPIDDSVTLHIPKLLTSKLIDTTFSRSISEDHKVVADYPRFEEIHSSAPSSGFFIYRLMLAIRYYLAATDQHNLEIVLLGFNHDKKTDYFWHGHNWDFERAELISPPTGVRVIRQY